MAKKIIAITLGVLDLALLIVIIISAVSGWRIGGGSGIAAQQAQNNSQTSVQQQSSEQQVTSTEENPIQPSQVSKEPQPESSVQPSQVSKEPQPESSVQPSQVSKEPQPESSVQPSQVSKEPQPESSVQPSQVSQISVPEIPDSYSMSTDGYPKLEDIRGFDISFGWIILTDTAQPITDPSLILGGWKAYMLCDPENKMDSTMEKFTNINISYGQSDMTVTVDWYYNYFSKLGEGADDNTPDSVFKGSFSDGQLEAVGSGRITLYGFYYQQGREYAVGRMIFQDGTEAVIALVRP